MRIFTDNRTGEQYIEIPTRIPVKMQMYARTLAFATAKTMKGMYREAAVRFLAEKPWDNGLAWRPTKGLTTTIRDSVGQKESTGWMQVNMRFPVEVGNSLDRLSAEHGVSISCISYTMLYWWTWWQFPPASECRRRAALFPHTPPSSEIDKELD